MPVITIDVPPMSKEQKKEMVDKFARTASEILGLPVQSIVTIIREVEAENVGVGDNLLCDIPH
ncbi:4-oxalocrotonate tautomerase DmpI [Methanobacterium formicicum]|jgi:4-oxalocrotonate tautomerase|uniref:4-oxalocrotonate tautomerase DmpI n=1 Tax=Methanobacterium formicicum TaxID=2162 RepID=UPI002412AECF|nr:4-oxalocrotonate tautomerase DmpI [Methanobacterium formicicum]MDG3547156.1 tautomerase family protein [Methanobacterium formicicum]